MKLAPVLAAVAVVVTAAVCVRLGFWQISRLHEKQALNAALSTALARPPLRVVDPLAMSDSLLGYRVQVRGTFDPRRHVLLAARSHAGSPGVSVVTPLVLADGAHAVLVERGWLPAADATNAHPERFPEPGALDVVGIAEPLPHGHDGLPVRIVPADSATLWSMRVLDRDSVAARLPYALAGFMVRQLPGPGVPDTPLRTAPHAYDENMHLSYAVQWFLFAAILLGGSAILAWTRRRGGPVELAPRRP